MRYRPFRPTDAAVSALSLVLTDAPMRAEKRIGLIYAALESGINAFEIQSRDPAVATALGQALSTIDRRMLFVALRLGWAHEVHGRRVRDLSPDALTGAIEQTLARSGLGRIDVAILDVVPNERLPAHVLPALRAARTARQVGLLGVGGEEAADDYIGAPDFEVLATPFNLQSGWTERNRLKRAVEADMAIIGCDYCPSAIRPAEDPAPVRGLARLLGRKPHVPKSYDFLERTPGWTQEQICLGYALTEPSLATVQTDCNDPHALEHLAGVSELQLPTGVSAQIEMARFTANAEPRALAKRGA